MRIHHKRYEYTKEMFDLDMVELAQIPKADLTEIQKFVLANLVRTTAGEIYKSQYHIWRPPMKSLFKHFNCWLAGGWIRDTIGNLTRNHEIRKPKDIDIFIAEAAQFCTLLKWLQNDRGFTEISRYDISYRGLHGHHFRKLASYHQEPILIDLIYGESSAGRTIARFDFTVNAFAYHYETGELIYHPDAMYDLEHKILRKIDESVNVGPPRMSRFTNELGFKPERGNRE